MKREAWYQRSDAMGCCGSTPEATFADPHKLFARASENGAQGARYQQQPSSMCALVDASGVAPTDRLSVIALSSGSGS